MMRITLFALGVLAGAAGFVSGAQAQNYPWCAVLNMGDAAYNCGFVSREQCMTSVSGIGGFCEPNTQYVPRGGARWGH
jgi:hypothetical protein